jgi:hypothetical protein
MQRPTINVSHVLLANVDIYQPNNQAPMFITSIICRHNPKNLAIFAIIPLISMIAGFLCLTVTYREHIYYIYNSHSGVAWGGGGVVRPPQVAQSKWRQNWRQNEEYF